MKRIASIAIVIAAPFIAYAQGTGERVAEREVFEICSTIFTVGLFMLFILAIIKRYMDYRLKAKIVDKGIPESIASSILQTNPKEDRNMNIKWFALLAGIGAGLVIVNYTQPLGIHSLAIMALSVSASFLGYYLFTRYNEKE
jgi:drug/metabolite transporter (DMT)-like permease